jgi:hypothetical protein
MQAGDDEELGHTGDVSFRAASYSLDHKECSTRQGCQQAGLRADLWVGALSFTLGLKSRTIPLDSRRCLPSFSSRFLPCGKNLEEKSGEFAYVSSTSTCAIERPLIAVA